ncbi:MAG: amidohydrolase family protein [Thermoguttaceae bacterium]|nr:amidohydrolase family protein [Thermoguttaceae bacterium]
MAVTRRQFVGSAAAAILAGAHRWKSLEAAETAGSLALPIIDTHQHLWDLSRLKLPWLEPGGELTRSYVMDDYLRAIEGLNVQRAVYMEVAAATDQLVDEAEYVIDLCRRKVGPTVAAVIGGRPAEDSFRAYITRYKDSPYVKGVRHILPAPVDGKSLYLQKDYQTNIQLLGELGMSFDLCMPAERLPDAIKLVDACPETRFILDHCGNADPQAFEPARRAGRTSRPPQGDPEQWRRDIAELARRDRVVCKISGIVARANKENWAAEDLAPIVNHCLEVFGPDRVMFASDWPVCTRVASLRQWVEALQSIVAERSEAERRKLYHDNAERVYGLR